MRAAQSDRRHRQIAVSKFALLHCPFTRFSFNMAIGQAACEAASLAIKT
jgi:hypothetical protein